MRRGADVTHPLRPCAPLPLASHLALVAGLALLGACGVSDPEAATASVPDVVSSAGDDVSRDVVVAPDVAVDGSGTSDDTGAHDASELPSDVVDATTGDADVFDAAAVDAASDVPADGAGDDAGAIPAEYLDESACAEVDGFVPVFRNVIERWVAQDTAAPGPPSPLLIVGSSSVRRWEAFAKGYAAYGPVQRGFGGSQLGEVALYADELVIRHDPRGVIVFAGTNDVAGGVAPDVVVQRVVCLRRRVGLALGWSRPLLFVGITPTPSRWAGWSQAAEVNARIASLAERDAGLIYVDVPAAFLDTGAPPAASLFVDDMLHLSPDGYALWDSVLRPAVEAVVAPRVPPAPGGLDPGTRIGFARGPPAGGAGARAPSPDYLGQHWNNWHALAGGGQVVPGEHLSRLVTDDGVPTSIDLVVSGGFYANGWRHGGLRWPDRGLLGDLAVGSATGDFFYAQSDDATGGFYLRGLDPDASYTLRVFGARNDVERRVTSYRVAGEAEATASLQTSGPGAARDGGTGNDDDLAVLVGVRPDPSGQLFVDVGIVEGAFAYVSALELVVE